ncbi:MAG: cell division protein FtsZ, partial [Candidatus Acidiferrales bacterium]
DNANIIFGAVHDESMGDEVKVTVIATGIKNEKLAAAARTEGLSAARAVQETLKTAVQRKDRLPIEAGAGEISAELPPFDYEVPAFLRRKKTGA